MNKARIHLVAGARPNFMKIAPLYHALSNTDWAEPVIVHTDQHYDPAMSAFIFDDLGLPHPDYSLGVGSGMHGEQTAKVMIAYEQLVLKDKPQMTVVVGDVNSTVAASLVAIKSGILCAHLEAGLRSFDRTMPEEINRLVTDSIADLLWTPSEDGNVNLLREGVSPDKIEFVGNIMIDSFEMLKARIVANNSASSLGLQSGNYGVLTLHRPSNVDSPEKLTRIVGILEQAAAKIALVFPIHPRTRKQLTAFGLLKRIESISNLILVEPVPYIPFMNFLIGAKFALTDSGGIQEETTYMGIPCLTLRENTERPITISLGSNKLVSLDNVSAEIERIIAGTAGRIPRVIEKWDGRTAQRVSQSIRRALAT